MGSEWILKEIGREWSGLNWLRIGTGSGLLLRRSLTFGFWRYGVSYLITCRLDGVVVSVPATGPKGRGFDPGQGDGFLRAIKIRSTPSFGLEVKPEVSCRKILRHVKDLFKSHRDGETNFSFPSPILLLAPEISLLTGPPDSTGGCQSALVDKLGVSPSGYHHTMVHITITLG
jgi:hypothetical protein